MTRLGRMGSLVAIYGLMLVPGDLAAQMAEGIRGEVKGRQPTGEMIVQLSANEPVSVGDRVEFWAAAEGQAAALVGVGQIAEVAETMLIVRITDGTPGMDSTAIVESRTQALGLTADDLVALGVEIAALEQRLDDPSPEMAAEFQVLATYTSGGPLAGPASDEAGAARAYILTKAIHRHYTLSFDLLSTLRAMGALRDGDLRTSCRYFTGDPPAPPDRTEAAVDFRLRTPIGTRGAALLAAWRLLEAEGEAYLRRFAASTYRDDDDPVGKRLYLESFTKYWREFAEEAATVSQGNVAVDTALKDLVGAFEDPSSGASKRYCEAAIKTVYDYGRAVDGMSFAAEFVAGYLQ
ncbi:MAG: hypothetical protein ACE5FP_06250 [Gemmatimonadota bacterium]